MLAAAQVDLMIIKKYWKKYTTVFNIDNNKKKNLEQIAILKRFPKDHVTLKTVAENSALHLINKLYFKTSYNRKLLF